MSTKAFRIEAVLGVFTGFVLEDGGFAGKQELMDHFYPGIMTIGCAAMQPAAKAELLRQHPKLAEVVRVGLGNPDAEKITTEEIDSLVSYARVCFGNELEIAGPLNVAPGEVEAAFKRFMFRC